LPADSRPVFRSQQGDLVFFGEQPNEQLFLLYRVGG
jgi:hypothetical protein